VLRVLLLLLLLLPLVLFLLDLFGSLSVVIVLFNDC